MSMQRIAGFALVSDDPERLAAFYAAIGFTVGAPDAIDADEMRALGLEGTGRRWPLTLGPSTVSIDQFERAGRPYPADATAADLVFQHLAIVTDDAAAAWARARSAGAMPISRDCPVTLPESSGGVTAVKFRDPDGHPLEFLQFPPGANPDWSGHGVLGIDHSAVSVADVTEARRFYADHGLSEGDATVNEGSTQVALDGLDGVVVDVVPMNPARTPAHVELLGYRTPRGRPHPPLRVNDIAATRIVWHTDRDALLRDPDGHLHQLRR